MIEQREPVTIANWLIVTRKPRIRAAMIEIRYTYIRFNAPFCAAAHWPFRPARLSLSAVGSPDAQRPTVSDHSRPSRIGGHVQSAESKLCSEIFDPKRTKSESAKVA